MRAIHIRTFPWLPIIGILLAAALLLGSPAPSDAAEIVLVSNTGQHPYGGTPVGPYDHAQGFTTGKNTRGYVLTSIELQVHTAPANGTLTVSVREADGQDPSDTVLYTLTNPSNLGTELRKFTAPANSSLSAETTYFVHMTFAVGLNSTQPQWGLTDRTTEDSGAYDGWSIANVRHSRLTGSSVSWSNGSDARIKIKVKGENRAPAAPVNLSAAASDGQVTLSWDNPGNDTITKYQYSTDGGTNYTDIAGSGATTTSYTVTGLTNGTQYTFAVRAVNDAGDGLASTDTATPEAVPDAPRSLTATGAGTSVTLGWTASVSDGGRLISKHQYRRKAGTDAYGNWTDIPESAPESAPGGANAIGYTVTGLDRGKTYTFEVRAVNSVGNSIASVEAEASTAPAAPANLSAAPGDGQAALTWDDPGNTTIAEYQLMQLAEKSGLIASDGALNDRFGVSVAVDDDTAVVGAFQPTYTDPDTSLDVSRPGAAYVYTKDSNGAWSQQAKLTASAGEDGDEFGISVAVDGDTVVVGARGNGSKTGAIYVFTKPSDGDWTSTITETKLTATSVAAGDRFGAALGLDGNTIVIGAPGAENTVNGADVSTGSAYVFARDSNGDWSQKAKLTASNAAANDEFGNSVAVDGNTIAVGAHEHDGTDNDGNSIADSGLLYVFTKSNTEDWATDTETVRLRASDRAAGDNFGRSVAVGGDTIVVGAPGRDGIADGSPVTASGAAYVFTKAAADSWATTTETVLLTASDPAASDKFGRSAAVDGETVLVGGHQNDDNGDNSGSFYIFVEPSAGWAEGAAAVKITASDGKADDRFGIALALDGDTAIVAAPRNDANDDDDDAGNDVPDAGSAYVLGISTWVDIPDSDQDTTGHMVSGLTNYITYTMAVRAVNATGDGPGSVVAFLPAPAPDAPANLKAEPGDTEVTLSWTNPNDVSISGYEYSTDYTMNGDATFTPMTGSNNNTTGDTVTGLTNATEYTLAVRAWNATGPGMPSAVTVTPAAVTAAPGNFVATPQYRRVMLSWDDPGDTTIEKYRLSWYAEPYALMPEGVSADDFFGHAIAMDGDTALIGAPQNATDPGLVYVLTRDAAGTWSEQGRLEASGGADYNLFGWSVAVDGNTAVVGAIEDEREGAVTGAAYVFTRDSSGRWSQQARLIDDDLIAGDQFGYSVAVDGDTAVVGAGQLVNSGPGAVYVFTRESGTWSRTAKLSASDGANGDEFGLSVALDEDTVVVGAPRNDKYDDNNVVELEDPGAAYVFTKDSGGNWVQAGKLTAFDRAKADWFGQSVTLDDDTVLVGAPGDDDNGSDPGSAYLFSRPNDGWTDLTEQQKLADQDGAVFDQFGYSVAIDGDIAVVGVHGDDDVGTDAGAALLFNRDASGVWSEATKLTASDGAAGDQFGYAVGVSGGSILIGAYAEDGSGLGYGSVYSSAAQEWMDIAGSGATTTSHTVRGLKNDVTYQFRIRAVNLRGSGNISEWASATPDSFPRQSTGLIGIPDNLQVTLRWDDPLNPTITQHQYVQLLPGKLTASDGSEKEYFGTAVAVDGDTAVVGAHLASTDNPLTGSAYVFTKDAVGNWSQAAQLTASDGWNADVFGSSVALDGDTIVVGAYGDEVSNEGENPVVETGAAYVFVKPGGGWATGTETAKLTASDAAAYDAFGYSVAVDGDTVVVGVPGDGSGSAYVFVKPGGGWDTGTEYNETAKLTASDRGGDDEFGQSVGASGDTVLVGAPGDGSGSAYVFIKPAAGWDGDITETAKLTASDGGVRAFGRSVALTDQTAVVGAPLSDGTDSDGNTISDSGAAYVFVAPIGGWAAITPDTEVSETAQLTASDGGRGDEFGFSVASDGNTAVVAAHKDDDAGGDSGSVYVFAQRGASWDTDTESIKVIAPDGAADDNFGRSVAVDGDAVMVGAHQDDDKGSNSGSVYAYHFDWSPIPESGAGETNSTSYTITGLTNDLEHIFHLRAINQFGDGPASDRLPATPVFMLPARPIGLTAAAGEAQVTLSWDESDDLTIVKRQTMPLVMNQVTASDGAASDYFGYSAAIDGDTAVVGAHQDDGADTNGNAIDDSGSAYVLTRDSNGDWNQVAKLTASDGAENDNFGISVAVSGDTVVVGASGDATNIGSAYVFVKPVGGWADATQTAKLTASDRGSGDELGISVAVDGDTVVVGAPADDSEAGSAYVFVEPLGGWADATQTAKLTASDRGSGVELGISVTVDASTIVVGGHKYDGTDSDGNVVVDSGAAYLFVKPLSGWANVTQTAKLTASDGVAGDQLGVSVAVSGDTAVVGANQTDGTGADGMALENVGSAYVFVEPDAGWATKTDYTETAKLTASDGASGDQLGISVAVGDEIIVVGAHQIDSTDNGGKAIADSGSAYVFSKPTLGWADGTESARMIIPDAAATSGFGRSVAMDGDTAVIGAYLDDGTDSNGNDIDDSGSAHFLGTLEWVDMPGTDAQVTSHTVTGLTNYLEYTLQVRSVNVSGHSPASGSARAMPIPKPDQPTGLTAAAGLSRVSLTWDEAGALPPIDSYQLLHLALSRLPVPKRAEGAQFGVSTAMDSNTAVIGSPREAGDSGLESAQVFTRDSSGMWSHAARLTPSDGAAGDKFGWSVAVDGNTVVVGAYGDAVNGIATGSAYVFTRDQSGVWSQAARLIESDGAADDKFGRSVAVDGDTVVVGAYGDAVNGIATGSAYVFTRDRSGVWSQAAKLIASDGAADDHFGWSIAMDGAAVVVGAYQNDGADTDGNAINDSGSAYLFVEPNGGWAAHTEYNETAQLTASDGDAGDKFGWSVAVDGDTVVVGAYQDDGADTDGNAISDSGSVYVFNKPDTGWATSTETVQLTASDAVGGDEFGNSVALDGGILLVGAHLSNNNDSDGNVIDDSGSVYVFREVSGLWTRTAKITPSEGGTGDRFGHSVTVGNGAAAIGAYDDTDTTLPGSAYTLNIGPASSDGSTIWTDIAGSGATTTSHTANSLASRVKHHFLIRAVNTSGHGPASEMASATVYSKPDKPTGFAAEVYIAQAEVYIAQLDLSWDDLGDPGISNYQLAEAIAAEWLIPDDLAAGHEVGISVAVDGDTAVVGAYHGDSAISNSGAAYIFTMNSEGQWVQEAKLTASDGAEGDQFGWSVAVDDGTIVVGAYRDDHSGLTQPGSAYIFRKDANGSWVQDAKLTATDAADDDLFGVSVAVDRDTIVVGAPLKNAAGDDGVADNDDDLFAVGAAYVFKRDSNGDWSLETKLPFPEGLPNDTFGFAVAVEDNTALIAATGASGFGRDYLGRVLVFTRESGSGVWSQATRLTASDGAARDWFGYSVALDGDTAVIGARLHNDRLAGAGSGAAYVFARNSESGPWSERAKLTASDGAAQDNFGFSVALDGDTVVVGAWLDDDNGADSGSVYIFKKPDAGWSDTVETDKLTAPDGAANDKFGAAVAVIGDRAVVGAHKADYDDRGDSGSAYLFGIPDWADIANSDESTISHTVTDLDYGTEYTYQIRAVNAAGAGPASNPANGTPLNVPAAPSGLSVDEEDEGDEQVALIWDAPAVDNTRAPITKYQYSEDGGRSFDDIPGSGATTTAYTVTGLANGTEYTFQVRAVNFIGTGLSSLLKATPASSNPDPPVLTATAGDTQVLLEWLNPGDSTIVGYEYTWTGNDNISSGAWQAIPGPIAYNHTVTGLANGTEYTFQIRAVGNQISEFSGPSLPKTATPMGMPPGAPTGLTAIGEHEEVKLAWDDPNDYSIDKYEYKWTGNDNTSSVTPTSPDGWQTISPPITHNYTVTGLVNGTEYTFEIRAVDDDEGIGDPASDSAKPLPPVPDPPILNDPAQGNTQVTLTWSPPANVIIDGESIIDGYQLLRILESSKSPAPDLIPDDGIAGDYFGYSVAVDGDTAVIGAYGDDGVYPDSGSAYVFTRNSATDGWSQAAKLTASDGNAYDNLGISVAVEGDTVVVGAYGDDENGNDSGAAYVFVEPATGWADATETAKLTASDPAEGDWFGYSVAVYGDVALVGAPQDDNANDEADSGSVYVFTRDSSGAWSQKNKLTASDGDEDDHFGIAVALAGRTAVIGSYLDDDRGTDSGSTYVFIKNLSGNWVQSAKLTPFDGEPYDRFGISVALDGNTVVVGAHGEDDNGSDSGAAYVFRKPANGWAGWIGLSEEAKAELTAKLTALDGAPNDNFGISVALDDNTVVVGAYQDDGDGADGNAINDSGSAYVFFKAPVSGEWRQEIPLTSDDGEANDWFGYAIAADGNIAVIGAYGSDDNGVDSGLAYFTNVRDWTDVPDSGPLTTSHTVAGLENGVEYNFQVRAVNIAGESVGSNKEPITPFGSALSVYLSGPTSVSYPEDDSVPLESYTANDTGTGDITWTLLGEDDDVISLNAGVLSFIYSPNYESPTDQNEDNEYEVTVRASGATWDASLEVTIKVVDVNDAPQAVDDTLNVVEGAGATSLNVIANDWDEDADTLNVTMVGAASKGTAVIKAGSTTRVTYTPNAGAIGADSFTYTVSDGNGGTATGRVAVNITSGDPRVPKPSDDDPKLPGVRATTFTVPEDAPIGTEVGGPAHSADGNQDGLQYSLVDDGEGSFHVDSATGQLTTAALLDYETRTQFLLRLRVTDGQGGSSEATVTINVMDVDEPPDAPAAPEVNSTGPNTLAVGWTEPDNRGPEITDYDVRYREAEGEFQDAGHDGIATSLTLHGLLPLTVYEVQVRASNDEGTGPWSESGQGQTEAESPLITATPTVDATPTPTTTTPPQSIGTPAAMLEATATPEPVSNPTPAPTPERTAIPTAPSASTPAPTVNPTPLPTAGPVPTTAPTVPPESGPADSGGGFPWWLILLLVIGGVVIILLAFAWRRRRQG